VFMGLSAVHLSEVGSSQFTDELPFLVVLIPIAGHSPYKSPYEARHGHGINRVTGQWPSRTKEAGTGLDGLRAAARPSSQLPSRASSGPPRCSI